MKKIILSLVAIMMTTIAANAFKFDGIDLNADAKIVTQEISAKGYTYDPMMNCLKGDCQGTEIYLSFNLKDVTEKGHVGQLILDIPMTGKGDAYAHAALLFNVIYHQTSATANAITYSVDEDGTTMKLSPTKDGIRVVYSTPYYKSKK